MQYIVIHTSYTVRVLLGRNRNYWYHHAIISLTIFPLVYRLCLWGRKAVGVSSFPPKRLIPRYEIEHEFSVEIKVIVWETLWQEGQGVFSGLEPPHQFKENIPSPALWNLTGEFNNYLALDIWVPPTSIVEIWSMFFRPELWSTESIRKC